jgi:hypothetical protein
MTPFGYLLLENLLRFHAYPMVLNTIA